MMTKSRKRIFNDIIMTMNSVRPMDQRERRSDLAYAILLTLLFVIMPIIVCPILSAFYRPLYGLIFLAFSWGLALAIGLTKRKSVISNYYQVKDPEQHVQIIRVDQPPLPPALDDILLVFPFEVDEQTLPYVYNWLYQRETISPDTQVTFYQVMGSTLTACRGVGPFPDVYLLCIPIRALNLNESNTERFAFELEAAGARLYDCRIGRNSTDGELANKASVLDLLST